MTGGVEIRRREKFFAHSIFHSILHALVALRVTARARRFDAMLIRGMLARRSRPRRVRPPWRPTFDVHESVAAAVLARVSCPRDRLALACVSRMWRRAAATAGAWGTCDLVLKGELGEKVTDERFERLMLYCGDVKHLEVRAPGGFKGWFFDGWTRGFSAAKFAVLTAVVLTGCQGVDGARIVKLMLAIGMTNRPKKDRLRRLHVDGCQVEIDDLATLSECVSLGRLENYVACSKASHSEQDGIDVCVCLNCIPEHVICMQETLMCYSCLDTCCKSEGPWGFFCDGCPANVCDKAQCVASLRWYACEACSDTFCGDCESSGKITVCNGSNADDGCFESFCSKCEVPSWYYTICMKCDGRWCQACWPEERMSTRDKCCPTCEVTEFIFS